MPSDKASLIALGTSCTRNSEHDRGAVLVVRSLRLLQSAMAMSAVVSKVGAVMAGLSWGKVCSGFLQFTLGSCNHDQKIRSHASWSSADANEVDSAARVLVTTLWTFLHPHAMGLIGHCRLLAMSLCVPTMIIPACESGFLFEETVHHRMP